MDRRLAGLPAGSWGFEPRFYPPGQHPATHRMREQAKILRSIRSRLAAVGSDTANVDASLDYIDSRMAAFEEQETECKQRTLAMLERRERR